MLIRSLRSNRGDAKKVVLLTPKARVGENANLHNNNNNIKYVRQQAHLHHQHPWQLPELHPTDRPEVATAIHVLQNKLLARPTYRKYLEEAKAGYEKRKKKEKK